jgi:hypothetical protein
MLTIAALLAGCATAAQRQYQAMATGNRAAGQEMYACAMAVYDSAEFAPLREHIAIPPDRPSLEQLSDPSPATDGQIRLLLAAHPKVQACRQQLLDRLTASTPSFAAILATLYAKADDSLIQLISKKESWGEHTTQVRDLAVEARNELTAEAERITAALQQSHEAELAQRQAAAQAAAAAFAQYAQTQQIINNMNLSNAAAALPHTTRCSWIGGFWTCQ